jgi:hypothetical protein
LSAWRTPAGSREFGRFERERAEADARRIIREELRALKQFERFVGAGSLMSAKAKPRRWSEGDKKTRDNSATRTLR